MVDLKITLPKHFLEGETRIGYYIAPEMKKVWAVELDLLNEFARVCAKHKLHHGFIPWDDDIDVVMPRIDYEKLCNLAVDEFTQPYFLQNEDSDPLFGKVFSKLVNLKTTCLEYSDKDSPSKHCIFIDIFPYDHIPDGDYIIRVGTSSRETSIEAVLNIPEFVVQEKYDRILEDDARYLFEDMKNPGKGKEARQALDQAQLLACERKFTLNLFRVRRSIIRYRGVCETHINEHRRKLHQGRIRRYRILFCDERTRRCG